MSLLKTSSRSILVLTVLIALLIPVTLLAANKRWELQKNSIGPIPTLAALPELSPIGEQKTLVIMFNFQDKPNDRPWQVQLLSDVGENLPPRPRFFEG